MTDPSNGIRLYFQVSALLFLFGSALPLLLVPRRWGRAFGWDVPDDAEDTAFTMFSDYLGRCLGGIALVMTLAALRASAAPLANLLLLEIIIATSAVLGGVHIYGALRRRQPWQETLEIGMYAGLVAIGGWLYLLAI